MRLPRGRVLGLDPNVLTEESPGRDRLLLWRCLGRRGWHRRWERIGSAPRAPIVESSGTCAVAATADVFRQPIATVPGWLLKRLRGCPDEETWVLPDGSGAAWERKRRRGLYLVWSATGPGPLEAPALDASWPSAVSRERLGRGLWLVDPGLAATTSGPAPGRTREPHTQMLTDS